LLLAIAVFAEMLENLHLAWLTSQCQSLTAKMTTEEICSAADKEKKLQAVKMKSIQND
jgi:hypothetical protein